VRGFGVASRPNGGIDMATPASSGVSPLGTSADVFEHLAHCDRLLTAKELAKFGSEP
jgi:hypothetical protein